MTKMNAAGVPRFKGAVTRKLLLRFFVTVVLYVVAITFLAFLVIAVYSTVNAWQNQMLFRIAHWLWNRVFFFAILFYGGGILAIFSYYWMKTLDYLNIVLNATRAIYEQPDTLIVLPPELKEIEAQMNQIRNNIQLSERAAKESEQRKNDLVVYLAHDLKTPLTSVLGYLMLLRDEPQISDEIRKRYLSVSLDKAERLEDLINEFFEITRFNLTNITLDKTDVNLTRMLEQLVYEFRPMLVEKELVCDMDIQQNLRIKCDVNKMERVLDNILRNAVNYSFRNSKIYITAETVQEGIRINFLNRGNTIPKEKLERIFEQFFRLDSSRATESGGAGLGLAIAREIIELHGGNIAAYSQDQTISFEIHLPVS